MDNFKEVIKEHLDGVAKKDSLFAKTYANESKNIDDCCTYVINEVKKSGRQGFTDAEIFNMAIHYYDESEIEVGPKVESVTIVTNRPSKNDLEVKPEKKKEPVGNSILEKEQLSLF